MKLSVACVLILTADVTFRGVKETPTPKDFELLNCPRNWMMLGCLFHVFIKYNGREKRLGKLNRAALGACILSPDVGCRTKCSSS